MAGFVADKVEDALVGSGPALLRPPGALDEFAFLTACTRCDKCLPACPVDAIVGAPRCMHTVIARQCTGCALCLPPCPVDCIELQPVEVAAEPRRTRHAA